MQKFWTVTLLLLPFLGLCQNINKSQIKTTNFCDTIPFEYVNGKMIVEVDIGGQHRRFLFDTGAPLIISSELSSILGNSPTGKGEISDVTGKSQQLAISTVPQFLLGKIAFEQSTAIVFNKDSIGLLACFDIDGFIGSTVLKHCIVHIDIDKKIIVLTDDISNLTLQDAHRFKAKLDANSRPFINIKVNGQTISALFDSGSGKFLPLSMNTFHKLNKKGQLPIIHEGYGSISSGLFGTGQQGNELIVELDEVQFGNVRIDHVQTTVSEHKNKNAIGMGLAQYGTVTVDYLNKQFYFCPVAEIQTFRHSPFFGFVPQLVNGAYVAGAVYQGSPAEKIGLKTGNRILRINEYDVSGSDMDAACQLFLSNSFSRNQLDLTFIDDDGKTHTRSIHKE